MAMSKFCLRTMADIERPAIAAIWPTLRGESIVLDVGATIGADAQQREMGHHGEQALIDQQNHPLPFADAAADKHLGATVDLIFELLVGQGGFRPVIAQEGQRVASTRSVADHCEPLGDGVW